MIGKNAEIPLMRVLCSLYGVKTHHPASDADGFDREVDYVIVDDNGKVIKCEVKLMGKGNPESADASLARDADLFVTNTLGDTIRRELNKRDIPFVIMQGGWINEFGATLDKLGVSHTGLDKSVDLAETVKRELGVG